MFLINYLEVFAVVGVAAVLLGPKDLLPVARNAGWIAGRAGSYLSLARNRYAAFAQEAEVAKLNAEVQQSMHQLHAIRAELQSGINIFDPGPVGRRLLKMQQQGAGAPGQPGTPAMSSPAAAASMGSGASQAPTGASLLRAQAHAQATSAQAQEGKGHQAWRQMAADQQIWPGSSKGMQHPAEPNDVQSGFAQPPERGLESHAASDGTQAVVSELTHLDQNPSQHRAASASGHLKPQTAVHQQDVPARSSLAGSGTMVGGFSPLPVSAVATGAAPDRAGTIPTGSDIAFDALMEEQVAAQAQAYLSSPEGRDLTGDHSS